MSDHPGAGVQLHGLQAAFPGWRIWYVLTWDGARRGVAWCARSPDGTRLLHADTARHLADYIADTPGLAPGSR